jgi:Transglycosylase SLT domain
MKALQAIRIVGATWIASAICIVGTIPLKGMIHQVTNAPATVVQAVPEAIVNSETSAAPVLAAAAPAASVESVPVPEAEPVVVTSAVSAPSLMAKSEVRDDPVETKSADTKSADTRVPDLKLADLKLADLGHPEAAQAVPATRDASVDAPKAAQGTQDFRYLIYYVWSELPPAEKPAAVVLRSFRDIPVGTPIEEIKRASDAFGLDFNFMKAVAKIESGFDPKQRTGSYMGLFQLSKYEFNKYGSGQILDPRDNAVAAAYKVITEGILFDWVTHRTPTLSDLYLIHQQGWEGAAEHIAQPDRIAWKSMCATGEGREKGEKWCKRAIWGNTLPAVKKVWKSVDDMTSDAFVGMWRERVAGFMTKYMSTATAAAERANQ